jgi:hypothetical protein
LKLSKPKSPASLLWINEVHFLLTNSEIKLNQINLNVISLFVIGNPSVSKMFSLMIFQAVNKGGRDSGLVFPG